MAVRFSLEGKLALQLGLALMLGISIALGVGLLLDSPWLGLTLGAMFAIPLNLYLLHRFMRPVGGVLRALGDGISGLADGDFSLSVAQTRDDELGRLIAAYNGIGEVLRKERQSLYQRELLLDTVIQTSPLALVLAGPRGAVVYSNATARQLLGAGRKLEGLDFDAMLERAPGAFREAVAANRDGLFTVEEADRPETYHLAQKSFVLNGQTHRLYLFKQLTRELNRAEVETWKKVIRVIGHELNNSLAPVSSLAHSGKELAARGDREQLAGVFDTIEERTRHLKQFIEGYAQFAKLPRPRPAAVEWQPFLQSLGHVIAFRMSGTPPKVPGCFDKAQVQQVLINLLKNAHESGSASDAVELTITREREGFRLTVLDRGSGMSEQVMANALLPFYSTKRSGSGLGLPLCREVVEAHGGRLGLANREAGGLAVSLWLPARPQM